MSKIRAKNTKPELFIRSELHRLGYRFRVNSTLVEGHPDIYIRKNGLLFLSTDAIGTGTITANLLILLNQTWISG